MCACVCIYISRYIPVFVYLYLYMLYIEFEYMMVAEGLHCGSNVMAVTVGCWALDTGTRKYSLEEPA